MSAQVSHRKKGVALLGVLSMVLVLIAFVAVGASASRPVVAAGGAAALDCRPIIGTFGSSDLCKAIRTPASKGFGKYWKIKRVPSNHANCDAAIEWARTPGNAGKAPYKVSYRGTFRKIGPSVWKVEMRMAPIHGLIMLREPTWPGITKYERAAVDELMRRLEAHELGHLQVISEV